MITTLYVITGLAAYWLLAKGFLKVVGKMADRYEKYDRQRRYDAILKEVIRRENQRIERKEAREFKEWWEQYDATAFSLDHDNRVEQLRGEPDQAA